jgi:COP9 signalosome complex subunit 12
MDYKKWARDCLKAFIDYKEDALNKLLFKTNISNAPKSSELKLSIQDILINEFEVQEGENAVWVNFLTEHIDATSRKHQIFRHLNLAFQSLAKIYKEEDEGYLYINTIKIYASKLLKEGTRISNLKEVVNSLRMLISACQSNKPPPKSQVIGLYYAINITFRASFRLNNLQHVASLLRIVNSEFSKYPVIRAYPKSQQIEFKYYEGKFHIYENNIEQAEECLNYAFSKCYNKNPKNEHIILTYLIPVKALTGKFPSAWILDKYELGEYKEMIAVIKQGNIKEFNKNLQKNQFSYIQKGILVIMNALKYLVYRNLFKKVYKILKLSQIEIGAFVNAIKVIGVDISLLEVECIFNNLIYRNWVKGCINSVSKVIVFKEPNPFPKIVNNL